MRRVLVDDLILPDEFTHEQPGHRRVRVLHLVCDSKVSAASLPSILIGGHTIIVLQNCSHDGAIDDSTCSRNLYHDGIDRVVSFDFSMHRRTRLFGVFDQMWEGTAQLPLNSSLFCYAAAVARWSRRKSDGSVIIAV